MPLRRFRSTGEYNEGGERARLLPVLDVELHASEALPPHQPQLLPALLHGAGGGGGGRARHTETLHSDGGNTQREGAQLNRQVERWGGFTETVITKRSCQHFRP